MSLKLRKIADDLWIGNDCSLIGTTGFNGTTEVRVKTGDGKTETFYTRSSAETVATNWNQGRV